MQNTDFYKFTLPLDKNLFHELSNSVDFEEVGKGRKGNHLVKMSEEGIPLVRTTTKYNKAAHNFSPIHDTIVESIKGVVNNKVQLSSSPFNNALIEIYDHNYAKMGYHSDQCLDLTADSYIALFSCYERPDDISEQLLRKLKIRSKTNQEELVLSLENNSVILFSLSTNTNFQHKIVLDSVPKLTALESDNRWLGLTFRKSKTLIHFKNNVPYFPNGAILKLADEPQKKEFYSLRGQENKNRDFIYPTIAYTLSVSDTLLPKDS